MLTVDSSVPLPSAKGQQRMQYLRRLQFYSSTLSLYPGKATVMTAHDKGTDKAAPISGLDFHRSIRSSIYTAGHMDVSQTSGGIGLIDSHGRQSGALADSRLNLSRYREQAREKLGLDRS